MFNGILQCMHNTEGLGYYCLKPNDSIRAIEIVNQKPYYIMRLVFTAIGVLAFLLSFGQANLTPSQLVNTAKTKGQSFLPTHLFSTVQDDTPELTRKLDNYITLELNEETLSQCLLNETAALSMILPSPNRNKDLRISLVKVDLFASGFAAVTASDQKLAKIDLGVHYRGVIEGEEGSVVALSFFEEEVMGLLSSPTLGNLVLGALEGRNSKKDYVLYEDANVLQELAFECHTSDEGPDYTKEQLKAPTSTRGLDDCVNIYLEIDNDVYQDKGGANGTVNYITGLFNEVATLYANENLNVRLSEIYMWDIASPYYGTNSYTLLTQFVDERPSFNGDLGQLISYKASGGIAYLSGLCSTYSPKHSFSSINSTYAAVPTYSFSVMVITHELGHLLGSRHTHACVWNGNNTAIDGCAGYVEGNCSNPGYPSGGGTIMSYCHLRSVGINFSHGFGTQPGNVIRNAVANAACLSTCDDDPDGNTGSGCDGQEISLRLVLDQYGVETSWELRDSNDMVIYSGGPYPNTSSGSVIDEALCLPEGCYTFEIFDQFNDGICCDFGNGSYELTDTSGIILAAGAEFASSEATDFCLPMEPDSSDCINLDFSDYDVISFGGAQDAGHFQLLENETVLKIESNAWKAIELDYEITPNTILEFEFASTKQGEIHGIGFDDNNAISANRTFRLYGAQSWGYNNYDNYSGSGSWTHYEIPVGAFYTGEANRLFFVADHDRSPSNGNSFFRNIRIYEGESCGEYLPESTILSDLPEADVQETVTSLKLYPNPVSDQLTVDYFTPQAGQVSIQAFSMTGQLVYNKVLNVQPGQYYEQLAVNDWPAGTYILQMIVGAERKIEKFNVYK